MLRLELLKAAARQRLAAGQGELDLGLAVGAPGGPLPITASRMGQLVDALAHGYRVLGFDSAAGGDEVFAQLVLARIIEPTSKLDSARALEEPGVQPVSYRTVKRRLPEYAKQAWRQRLSAACAGHGPRPGQAGFPLMVSAFEGSKAETKTMLPVIRKFMAAHQLPDVTVVVLAVLVIW